MSKWGVDFAACGPSLLVLLCILVGLPLGSYPQYVIAIAMISMVVGVALVIIVGLARCITLAAGSIMAIGAYASTLTMTWLGVPYLLALLLALIAGGAAGWLIALPGTRFRGHNLAMVTLVFQSVCIILIRESTWLTGGAEGIHVPTAAIFGWKIASDFDFLLLIGICSAVIIFVLAILARGPFGKNLGAAASNEVAAEAFGVNVSRYITAAFVVSSIAVAFAGALAAPRVRILDPDSFGIMRSILMLAYPIVGGMYAVWGGLIGGGGMRVLPELLRPVADYQELLFACLVVVVIMFFPEGLVGLLQNSFARIGKSKGRSRLNTQNTANVKTAALFRVPVDNVDEQKPLLLVDRVDKHFDALHAVKSASLLVPAGRIHGLIGPNGAGKTSLFNIISGFLEADSGCVDFAGSPLLDTSSRDRIRLGITRTFQQVAIFGRLSCLDNVIIGRGLNGVVHSIGESFGYFIGASSAATARYEALRSLESVGLASHAYSPAGALSLGDQRRLEIARAIVSNPRLILLDEPVSGLAESEIEDLQQLLLRINREQKIAMLVVEHNIPFVGRLCHSISVMGGGSIIAEGDPSDVMSMPIVRQLYFGEEIAA